jgi:anaerobic magnesium-protoporphyrin IX monomethyl ester cyclase
MRHNHSVSKSQAPLEKADCLLLNPPDLSSRYPFLGICLLAGVLRENGIKAAILDASALGLTIQEVVEHIKIMRSRIVGISIMSLTLRCAYQLIQAIKTNYPEGVIVVGGAHIDAVPESVRDLDVPFGFYGECEYEFLEFCKCILGGGKPELLPGLIVNADGELVVGEKKVLADLNGLPWPAYDLLPIEKYYSPSTHLRTMSFISSRGCPYRCLFCSKLQQKRYRFLSTDNLVGQLDWLVNGLKIQWVEFVDEIFTLHRPRVVELCEMLLSRSLKFHWGCGSRVDRIDEELLLLMKRAGCRKIGFGVESGVERVRRVIKKNITDKQVIDAVRLCRRHDIKTQTCFILGPPTESLHEMWQTVTFARKLGSNYPSFDKMIPIPGSELFELAKRNKEVGPDVWTEFMRNQGPCPLYVPQGISPKDIHGVFRKAWFYTYFWPPNLWLNRDAFFKPGYFLRAAQAFWDFACKRDY